MNGPCKVTKYKSSRELLLKLCMCQVVVSHPFVHSRECFTALLFSTEVWQQKEDLCQMLGCRIVSLLRGKNQMGAKATFQGCVIQERKIASGRPGRRLSLLIISLLFVLPKIVANTLSLNPCPTTIK